MLQPVSPVGATTKHRCRPSVRPPALPTSLCRLPGGRRAAHRAIGLFARRAGVCAATRDGACRGVCHPLQPRSPRPLLSLPSPSFNNCGRSCPTLNRPPSASVHLSQRAGRRECRGGRGSEGTTGDRDRQVTYGVKCIRAATAGRRPRPVAAGSREGTRGESRSNKPAFSAAGNVASKAARLLARSALASHQQYFVCSVCSRRELAIRVSYTTRRQGGENIRRLPSRASSGSE